MSPSLLSPPLCFLLSLLPHLGSLLVARNVFVGMPARGAVDGRAGFRTLQEAMIFRVVERVLIVCIDTVIPDKVHTYTPGQYLYVHNIWLGLKLLHACLGFSLFFF